MLRQSCSQKGCMHNLKHKKIVTIDSLQKEIRQIHDMRQFGLHTRLGFTNGCYDLFHAGHASLLNSAKESLGAGAKLIVGVNSDSSVRGNKGYSRPIIPHKQRAYMVACHSAVDYVFVFSEKTVGKYLKMIRPDIWFKGGDYEKSSSLNAYEANIAKKMNIHLTFLPLLDNVSSTNIINSIK